MASCLVAGFSCCPCMLLEGYTRRWHALGLGRFALAMREAGERHSVGLEL
jgi:hypothetical protein